MNTSADPRTWLWMMWLELNPANPPEKTLAEATAYYTRKYGCPPSHARVPTSWPDLNGATPPGLKIERTRQVLKRHVHLAADPQALAAITPPEDIPAEDLTLFTGEETL